jgi:hypothetical protein
MSRTKVKGAGGDTARRASGQLPPSLAGVPEPLRSLYELGLRVRRKHREGLSKKAAARAVDEEEGCGYEKSRQTLRIVERITVKDLVRLGKMRTKAGEPLSGNHLRALSGVADAAARRALIEGIDRHGWTAEELVEQIARGKGRDAGTGGPRLTRPKSLASGLDQVDRHCRDWLKHHDGRWSAGEADWLAAPAGGGDTAALLSRLGEVRGRLRDLARAALDLERRLAAVEAEMRA